MCFYGSRIVGFEKLKICNGSRKNILTAFSSSYPLSVGWQLVASLSSVWLGWVQRLWVGPAQDGPFFHSGSASGVMWFCGLHEATQTGSIWAWRRDMDLLAPKAILQKACSLLPNTANTSWKWPLTDRESTFPQPVRCLTRVNWLLTSC